MKSNQNSQIDPRKISSSLRTRWLGQHISFLESVDSSMNVLSQMVDDGSPEGSVLLVDHQRQGRGRQNRQWQAPPGSSLMLSIYLGPRLRDLAPEQMAQASLALGLAACKAIDNGLVEPSESDVDSDVASDSHSDVDPHPESKLCEPDPAQNRDPNRGPSAAAQEYVCRMKWPNDLQLAGRKVGGILAEAAYAADGKLDRLILGIGINVTQSGDELPAGATSLTQAMDERALPQDGPIVDALRSSAGESRGGDLDRHLLCADLLWHCEQYFERLIAGQSLVPEWAMRLNTLGHEVEARALGTGSTKLRGYALGLGPEGSLEILDKEGRIHRFLAGDISLRPVQVSAKAQSQSQSPTRT